MRDLRTEAIGSAALAGLVVGVAIVAPTDRVSALEVRAFRVLNDLPDGLHAPVWALMQSGSAGFVPVASLLALTTGDGGRRRRSRQRGSVPTSSLRW